MLLERKRIWIQGARVFVVGLLISALFPITTWAMLVSFTLGTLACQQFLRKREGRVIPITERRSVSLVTGIFTTVIYLLLLVAMGSLSLFFKPFLLGLCAMGGTRLGFWAFEKYSRATIAGIGK